MPHVKILNQNDINTFETPPKFNIEERNHFFHLSEWEHELVESFRTPTNKVGFILQLGYFKATNKFFSTRNFHQVDIEFVANRFNVQMDTIVLSEYIKTTFERHKETILNHLGFRKFNRQAKKLLIKEALALCSKQIKPRLMFINLIEFLRNQKTEIPNYHTFAEIITNTLRDFEKTLIDSIETNLSSKEKQLLDELLEFGDEYLDGEKQGAKIKRYKITLLKKSNQSTKPSKIKENILDLQSLNSLFKEIEPIINEINLSPELIQYYAQIVIKSRGFQMSRRKNRKYLLLIAFVVYQFYNLNDILIEVLMQAVKNTLNTSERDHKENFYNQRKEKNKKFNSFSKKITDHLTIINQAKKILNNKFLSSDDKVNTLQSLFSENFDNDTKEIQNKLNDLNKESNRIIKNEDYFDLLETKSIKLQNRASEIVKNIHFDEKTSNKQMLEAIAYYKQKDGNLTSNAPLDFLDTEEQKVLSDSSGKLRISLYKVLLFTKIADGIRSGALNLKYSYKYKAFDDYLISKEIWESNKDELLKKAGLLEVQDFSKLIKSLKKILHDQFKVTNENILNGVNKHATLNDDGTLKVKTPKQEKELFNTAVIDLFPQNQFISLFEVLSTVNQVSTFSDCFEYWQVKHNRDKPAHKTFFAGIIGYGCNLGIRKIAKISRNINQYELENTINWYFTHENIIRANDRILAFLDKLNLPKVFVRNKDITHTSSDGQKYSIGVESLNAGYSYKYFGKGKGVSIDSFIDESHRLFYSTVINPSEREAAYVIDGLMHNDVVQSDIHSTDTHGYSEMIFAVTHLLGISFAPRIKKFNDQYLYSFESPSILKDLNYCVLPQKKINTKLIEEQWDYILRLITTIKLKEATASQLFKRLSSYSKQHPLYRALKQFGRIIKTIFLLKYIDDVELRQMIEKQLNKLESSNKFGKAVFYGRNQEFQQSTKEEQLIADGCKRLVENAIICWNYLYLSKRIYDTKSEDEKINIIKNIRNSSVVAWGHINLQGEFDFSEEILENSIKFELPHLLEVNVN